MQFRLPETDDEDQLDGLPDEPTLPSAESAREMVLLGLAVIIGCQILHPVALGFLLIFGAVGAAAGALFALQEREAAAIGGVLLLAVYDVFVRPTGASAWVLATTGIAGGAFFLALGVGLLIRRAREGGAGPDVE